MINQVCFLPFLGNDPPKKSTSPNCLSAFFLVAPNAQLKDTETDTLHFPRNGEDYVHRVGRTGALRLELGCWNWLPESGPDFLMICWGMPYP